MKIATWSVLAWSFLTCIMLASSVQAETAATCVSVENDQARLQCYDNLFVTEPSSPSSEATEVDLSNWYIRSDVSPLTDETNVYIRAHSENAVIDRFGNSGTGSILFRCKENTTSFIVEANDMFLSDIQGYGRIEYRIDDLAHRSTNLRVSTDNSALGLWRGYNAIPFIEQLFGAERLVIRLTPYNSSPVTMEFDISNIEQAVGELRESSHW